MLTSTKEIEVSVSSALGNLGDQARGLEAVPWKSGATILDIGCGPGVHLDYFRSKGLLGTGLDRNPDYFQFHGEIEHVKDIGQLKGRQFDYVLHLMCSNIALTRSRPCLNGASSSKRAAP